ncbi:MAG: hypothetical protein SNJ74_12580 [Fimbriimonadaceae bacterium]
MSQPSVPDSARSRVEKHWGSEMRRFAGRAAVTAAILSIVPFLVGVLQTPAGSAYIGYQYNTDDHMVYSAWMRQAQDGRLLMDNRFAVDDQPGLTVHLLFFAMGLMSNVFGIPLTCALVKALFSGLVVWQIFHLACRINPQPYFQKAAIALGVLGGGVGFLVWHTFGEAVVRPGFPGMSALSLGRLPTDVWQPEAFVLPSMLTNALFMVSLSLILVVFQSVLDARFSWKPVLPGFLAYGLLMNIHSYDVLLIALVLVGLLAMGLSRREVELVWVGRVVVIGLGAVPAALWFLHVLANDPVFQSRAATETFSPNFRQVVLGLFPLIGLAMFALFKGFDDPERAQVRKAGATAIGLGILLLFAVAQNHTGGYWMGPLAFAALYAAVLGALALVAKKNMAANLVVAWSVVGLFAIYFPALFQRKLAMGQSLPWAILAALGLFALVRDRDKGLRNLGTTVLIAACGLSSVYWFQRELLFIRTDVSRTTLQPVYLTPDVKRITEHLNRDAGGRAVVLAMPGIPSPVGPDVFATPYLSDLNPILSGLTGVYTYAGHWSETPDYRRRRRAATAFFLGSTPEHAREAILAEIRPDFIVAPSRAAYSDFARLTNGETLVDASRYGDVVFDGSQFQLIRVRAPR